MIRHLAVTAAYAALVLTPLAASAHTPGMSEPERRHAIDACVAYNSGGRAHAIDVVDDGLGDYLVWVEDGKGGLWACNASGYGDVFANVRIEGDLLGGKGIGLIDVVGDERWQGPATAAEQACTTMAKDIPVRVATVVGDAHDGYIVWLQTPDQDLYLCNANARGEVFVFQNVDSPINYPGLVDVMT